MTDVVDLADELLVELLFTAEGRRDPYPVYHRLRELAPLHRSRTTGMAYVTRFDDIAFVSKDHRFAKCFEQRLRNEGRWEQLSGTAAGRMKSRLLLNLDPPEHTRLRSLVSKAFSPRVVASRGERIAGFVDELLDAAEQRGRIEVITELARPLPVRVVADMIGVPRHDCARLEVWSHDGSATTEPIRSAEVDARGEEAAVGFDTYFRELLAERRRHPGDDLATALIHAEDEGTVLNDDEIVGTLVMLFMAGFETTMNLIGNAVLGLLQRPGQLDLLRRDTTIDRQAVDELLRWDAPVQMTTRTALEDVELPAGPVSQGETVVCFLGAANRDPARFEDPDRLDLTRADNLGMSFGGGSHFCLGAALGRMEGELAITRLLRRFPQARLVDDEPRWRNALVIRGLERLDVALA